MVHPSDDRLEELGFVFSNEDKYIIKWFEGPAVAHVLDVTIFEDIGPSI